MKYKIGDSVLLLDTEFKPAFTALITDYNINSHQYEVEYQYPKSLKTEKIWVPQERLASPTYNVDDIKSM